MCKNAEIGAGEIGPSADPFDLARFTSAQGPVYDRVLSELRSGRKATHWMWFIFPQIAGLGFSAMSQRYALQNLDEARAYLAHPILEARLHECADAILAIQGRSASEIFGDPDDLKLHSSMTLFAQIAEPGSVFDRVLAKYFAGQKDGATVQALGSVDP